jgi:flavin-dependent dehydrogenase
MVYDVAIAGAGPAGCAAAIMLQQAGKKVCIADKINGSAFKMGESLPGAAQRLLKKLGVGGMEQLLDNADYITCSANVSSWGSDEWIYKDALNNPEGGGWHLNRWAFDAALRKKAIAAGVVWINGKIKNLYKEGTLFHVETGGLQNERQLNAAHWVVDATGRAGYITRKMGTKKEIAGKQMAVACWLNTGMDDGDQTTKIKSVADGWWYTAPLPHQKRVMVFHGLAETVATIMKNPDFFFDALNSAGIVPSHITEQQMLAPLKSAEAGVSKPTSCCGPGWLAVGDAALSFDPLSSQGIFFALYSGIRGAEAILSCTNSSANQLEVLTQYTETVNKVFTANQLSRKHYYLSERRYLSHPYWQYMQEAIQTGEL